MGSGMFPLDVNYSRAGKALLEASKLIQATINDLYDGVYSGDSGGNQYDNAASDGGSLALLGLAKDLIVAELKGISEADPEEPSLFTRIDMAAEKATEVMKSVEAKMDDEDDGDRRKDLDGWQVNMAEILHILGKL